MGLRGGVRSFLVVRGVEWWHPRRRKAGARPALRILSLKVSGYRRVLLGGLIGITQPGTPWVSNRTLLLLAGASYPV